MEAKSLPLFAALIPFFCLLSAACLGCGRDPDDLINSLANQSGAPQIVRLDDVVVPVYSIDYDWNEDARVREALRNLWTQDGEELWPHLVAHVGDSRYSFTRADSEDVDEISTNLTVGELCEMIARADLVKPIIQYYPGVAGTHPADRAGLQSLFHRMINWDDLKDLKAWQQKRTGKPLYELQIELCRSAIDEMERQDAVGNDCKTEFAAKMKEAIEDLARTKRPLVTGKQPFTERYTYFDAGKATTIRNKYLREQDAGSAKIIKTRGGKNEK